jgi:hypothetical protein
MQVETRLRSSRNRINVLSHLLLDIIAQKRDFHTLDFSLHFIHLNFAYLGTEL